MEKPPFIENGLGSCKKFNARGQLLDQRIYLVTGKGGVGKSVVAMAMAEKLAETGEETLLVELGENSYFSFALGFTATYEPQQLKKNLFHSLWSGESCLREYIRHLIPVHRIADLFFDNKVMRTFVRAAPGLKELALLGKLTSGVRQWGPPLPFKNIVLDAYSTGHFLALLRAPQGMGELIERGPMGNESRRIVQVLSDSGHTRYCVVTLPEELPVSESLELLTDIKKVVGLKANLICNRYYKFDDNLIREIGQAESMHDPFGEYLTGLNQKQKFAFQQLMAVENLQTLPYVLKAEVREVISILKNSVSVEWT